MIDAIPYYFTRPFQKAYTVKTFRKALYWFLLFNTITILPSVYDLFGYNGIGGTRGFSWDGTGAFLNLLSHPINARHEWIAWVFVCGQLAALILGLLNRYKRLAAIGVYFFSANLFLKAGLFMTGGEILVNILLFYLIFIDEDAPESGIQN